MSFNITRLAPSQLSLLALLDDGFPAEDSTGLMIEAEHISWLEVAESLRRLGLVELSFGWRGRFWLRLSEEGRALRTIG